MKKDLNLFEAYKKGSAKIGGKSNTGIILLISVFVIMIAGAYGTLFFIQNNIEESTTQIKNKLNDSTLVEDQVKLTNQIKKNALLNLYKKALKLSVQNFDDSLIIDKEILNSISSSIPQSVTVSTLKLTPQSVQLSCTCDNPLDPAAFTQSLNDIKFFDNIIYDGVVRDEESNKYFFNISLNFKKRAE